MTSSSPVFQVQLTVTPRAEGTLEILGVRWKLSGNIVGFHNFDANNGLRKVVKGRRKAKHSPNENLRFTVIKVHASIVAFLLTSLSLSLYFIFNFFILKF